MTGYVACHLVFLGLGEFLVKKRSAPVPQVRPGPAPLLAPACSLVSALVGMIASAEARRIPKVGNRGVAGGQEPLKGPFLAIWRVTPV
jgi:hypothetical protein